ncbi:MAG: cupredoxin domain-containing protein [candidate division WOR-3 bacterium]|jgi:plastocyanin
MSNKPIIAVVILFIILVVAGYFYFKKSTPSLSPEFQSQQYSPQPSEEVPLPQATTLSLPETTFSTETQEATRTLSQKETPEIQNIIIYTDSGYSPSTLKVKAGTTVTFKNQSSQAMWPASAMHPSHTVYSGTSLDEHCPDTAGIAFDACTGIQPGNSWNFTFNKKGSWKYHDHLNPSFTGTIIVE